MILKKKIIKKYKTKEKITEIFGKILAEKIFSNKVLKLHTITKIIDVESIDYTFEDFIIDFKSFLSDKKYHYNLWLIYSNGKSINEIAVKNKLHPPSLRFLFSGKIKINTMKKKVYLSIRQFDFFPDLKEDLKNFEIVLKDNFCKLIGEKDKLDFFKKKYEIKYPVLKYYNIYHIAFDGAIFEEIKLIDT